MGAVRGCLVLVMLAACFACQSARIELHGVVEYRERIYLPPVAEVQVDLLELRPGMAPAVVARRTLDVPRSGPIEFKIDVERQALVPTASHALRARIRLEERVVFESAEPLAVDLDEWRPLRLEVARQR